MIYKKCFISMCEKSYGLRKDKRIIMKRFLPCLCMLVFCCMIPYALFIALGDDNAQAVIGLCVIFVFRNCTGFRLIVGHDRNSFHKVCSFTTFIIPQASWLYKYKIYKYTCTSSGILPIDLYLYKVYNINPHTRPCKTLSCANRRRRRKSLKP